MYLFRNFGKGDFQYDKLYLLLLLLSCFNHVRLCATPHRQQPTRLPCSWDSPCKNTGVGCHFLLQCMKVKSESEVAQSCPTLSDLMDCSLPGSSRFHISMQLPYDHVKHCIWEHLRPVNKKNMFTWKSVYYCSYSYICNSPKLEKTQMSFSW